MYDNGISVMIKMIKPIVNISKIIDKYDTVILGYRGVVTDGKIIKPDVVNALINLKRQGKRVVLLSNTSQRSEAVIHFLHENKVPMAVFEAIVTAGEIMHYQLKAKSGDLASAGNKYFRIGGKSSNGVFYGLKFYQEVDSIAKADFIYVDEIGSKDDTIDKYIPLLEHAASLNIPMVCVGNDTSSYIDGDISLAPGALAEQYAVLGGKIITNGKPDAKLFAYAIDGLPNIQKEKTLVIGDSLPTDIKGAQLLGVDSVLVSKGIHVNFLGEGYISDVTKTRELAANFDASPDYVISNMRW